MKVLAITLILSTAVFCLAQGDEGLLLDDFETRISGGAQGTVDFGSGGDSSVDVAAADIKHAGKQSIKITYDASPGGYMWVARGFDLDAENAGWLVKPQDIQWDKYNAISFYMYGSSNNAKIAFDIKDNGNEMWRFMLEDNFTGWRRIVCPFSEFFVRGDWQPNNADKNAALDFPIKSFQFEPRPQAQGIVYFDDVELINK